jgi:hypothetical protein
VASLCLRSKRERSQRRCDGADGGGVRGWPPAVRRLPTPTPLLSCVRIGFFSPGASNVTPPAAPTLMASTAVFC